MRQKLLAVIGTTGVGKSQLGVELAKALRARISSPPVAETAAAEAFSLPPQDTQPSPADDFDAEIINNDALQVYKGLNRITNKMTAEERQGVRHHIFDCENPARDYNAHEFQKDAIAKISEIHGRKKIPILVGGTNYYVQMLLWNNALRYAEERTGSHGEKEDTALSAAAATTNSGGGSVTTRPTIDLDADIAVLYDQLKELDPIMAEKYHPNDRRKIRRSLQVFLETGKRHSDLIFAEKKDNPESSVRYRACIFWLHADREPLAERLDRRVDMMLKAGVLDELRELRKILGSTKDPENGQLGWKGIAQSIGYKEFMPYLQSLDDAGVEDRALYAQAVEQMKNRTKRYARQQVSWIRTRLWSAVQRSGDEVKIFFLDATDLTKWNENVRDVAIRLAQDFIDGNLMPDPASLSEKAEFFLKPTELPPTQDLASWKKRTCDVCFRRNSDGKWVPYVANGPFEWKTHTRSRMHRQNGSRMRKRKEEAIARRKLTRGAAGALMSEQDPNEAVFDDTGESEGEQESISRQQLTRGAVVPGTAEREPDPNTAATAGALESEQNPNAAVSDDTGESKEEQESISRQQLTRGAVVPGTAEREPDPNTAVADDKAN